MKNTIVKCAACGNLNTDNKTYTFSSNRGKGKTWMRCKTCRTYFLVDVFAVDKEIEHGTATSYGAKETGLKNAQYIQRLYGNIVKLVNEYRQPGQKKWLDVGCSFGGLMQKAKNEQFEVAGLDILPQAVDHIRSIGMNAELASCVADINEDERYDIISAIDSNYYWPDQKIQFAEIFKRLSPGGIFILRSTDKSWLVSLGFFFNKKFPLLGDKMIAKGLNDHRFSMPLPALLELASQTGFKVCAINIKDAYYSDHTPLFVRFSFLFGSLVYSLFNYFIAPGYIVVFRK